MSGSSQASDATNTTGGRTPSMKRRRNASGVWEYICKTTRKCKVESCSKTFSKNSATTTLIYHLHSDHDITVIDENIVEGNVVNKEKEVSNNEEDYEDDNDDSVPVASGTTATKHGSKIQDEIDALMLVITDLFK